MLISWYVIMAKRRRPRRLVSLEQLDASEGEEENFFDVCVVGAGPSGSVCSYYLACGGVRVLMLEKDAFPRDKVCGDVVSSDAIVILKEMGVWQRILERGCHRWINSVAWVGSHVQKHSVAGVLRKNRPVALQRFAKFRF